MRTRASSGIPTPGCARNPRYLGNSTPPSDARPQVVRDLLERSRVLLGLLVRLVALGQRLEGLVGEVGLDEDLRRAVGLLLGQLDGLVVGLDALLHRRRELLLGGTPCTAGRRGEQERHGDGRTQPLHHEVSPEVLPGRPRHPLETYLLASYGRPALGQHSRRWNCISR